MKTVLITGGTGLIGSNLAVKLANKGYRVTILSRKNNTHSKYKTYTWNYLKNEIEKDALREIDFIIHLAGTGIIDKSWTKKRKKEIINSRVKTTNLLFNTLNSEDNKVKAFISTSAIGFYGNRNNDHIHIETDPTGSDFLSKTCKLWENATNKINQLNIRTVKLRIGIVLTKKGGALEKMTRPAKYGLSAAIGNGKQYLPWIHIDDLTNIYIKAIEDQNMQGTYNTVSPTHTTNKEFTKTLAKTLKKPYWLPNIPAILLKLTLGKRSDLLLKGNRISAKKIEKSGFIFQFPKLTIALNHIINK